MGAGCSPRRDGPIWDGMEASARHAPVRLDHDTRCQSCGERLVAGDLAAIVAVSDTIVCLACAADRPEGEAGASAQREYDRRRQRRRDHARETLGLVGTVLAHVIEEPQSTKSWAQGAAVSDAPPCALRSTSPDIRSSCCMTDGSPVTARPTSIISRSDPVASP